MTNLEKLGQALAVEMDLLRAALPGHYAVTLVCRNTRDDEAHIILGQDGPECVIETVAKTMMLAGKFVGRASQEGASLVREGAPE